MKIGVFDSGVGGLSVANAIAQAMPQHEIIFRSDPEHVPYGTRLPVEIKKLCLPIFHSLVAEGCAVIVIACNTVSALLANELRNRYDIPFIALEPMVKPAAQLTQSKVITVCATPATLASPRYAWLKAKYAADCTVLEPDCSDWSTMIEQQAVNESKIANRVEAVLTQGSDVIVLGCTHYHWIEDVIKRLAGDKAVVIQPEQAIIRRLNQVLAHLP